MSSIKDKHEVISKILQNSKLVLEISFQGVISSEKDDSLLSHSFKILIVLIE